MAKADQEKQKELNDREAALEQREAELKEAMLTLQAMKGARILHKDVDAVNPAELPKLMLSEIGKASAGIEVETAAARDMSLDAFMEELVLIHVHADNTQGALEVITPNVNGINMPIIRGRDQLVRRKYVEALARSRVTGYTQMVPDSSRPESIQMVPSTQMTYPFSVRDDKNPRGRAWLDQILRTPA